MFGRSCGKASSSSYRRNDPKSRAHKVCTISSRLTRGGANAHTVSIYSFFYHALPPEGELSLEELHYVVRDIWLTRFDGEIEAEKAARRKGRPRSMKEQKLEEQKLRETELYRTGMGEPSFRSCPT